MPGVCTQSATASARRKCMHGELPHTHAVVSHAASGFACFCGIARVKILSDHFFETELLRTSNISISVAQFSSVNALFVCSAAVCRSSSTCCRRESALLPRRRRLPKPSVAELLQRGEPTSTRTIRMDGRVQRRQRRGQTRRTRVDHDRGKFSYRGRIVIR